VADEHPPHHVRALGPPQTVPVFNCQIYVAPRDAGGKISARCANLPEVAFSAATEREVLQGIVAAFKRTVSGYVERGEAIPFIAPPPKFPGESERLIGVHL